MCDINSELSLKLDDCGRRRHGQKLFKRRFRLDVRKYAFTSRPTVVDNWNLLSAHCVNG